MEKQEKLCKVSEITKKIPSPIPTLLGAQLTKIFQAEIRMILNCENHNNESNSKFIRKTILCEFTPDEFIDLNTKDSFVKGSGFCSQGDTFIDPETVVPIIDLIDKAKDNMSSPPEDVIQFAGHDLIITGDEYAIWYINYAIQQIKNNHQLMTDVINLSSASDEIYRFSENGIAIQGEGHTLIAIYKRLYCDYFNQKILPTTMIGILFQIRRALIPNDYNYDPVFAEQHRISQESEPDKNINIQEQSGPVKKLTPPKK